MQRLYMSVQSIYLCTGMKIIQHFYQFLYNCKSQYMTVHDWSKLITKSLDGRSTFSHWLLSA